MQKSVVVVAPHPDDETIGIGGTLLRHRSLGDRVYWVIVTKIDEQHGFSSDRVTSRGQEIEAVSKSYDFQKTFMLGFPTAYLDTIPMADIVGKISGAFREIQPDTVYLPYRGDIHSDHSVVSDAASACTKWFRHPTVKRVLCYEAPSETDFAINPDSNGFRPNVFVDISAFLETKIEIMKLYRGEMGEHPFPRSENAIRALAALRGAASGSVAAEACMLLKEII